MNKHTTKTPMFQPATSDGTTRGLMIARNAMRVRLEDLAFAHRWLCHPERACVDGCDGTMTATDYAARLALYYSDMETAD